MSRPWRPTNKKDNFFHDSYTLCLCWMHWFASRLIYSSLTKPIMQQRFHPSTSHLLLLDILFVLKVKLGTFLPIHRCAFWFNLKYIFVSLCKCELLEWNFCVDSKFQAGLEFVKVFRACIQNFFIALGVTIFFLSWRRFVVLTAVTSVREVIVIFFQLILFANTDVFFSSLLGLVSQSFWEGDSCVEICTRWLCLKEINHSRDSWLVLRSLQGGLSCLHRHRG